MKNVIIVGAGGFGRELYGWLQDAIREKKYEWVFKGFLDDNSDALKSFSIEKGIIGTISEWKPSANEVFLCGLGNPKIKKKSSQLLLERGAVFETLIHPTAIIGRNVKIGRGSIICPRVNLTCDVNVGEFVTMNVNSGMGHDSAIGSWSTVSAYCDITGWVQIGSEVFIGSHASVLPKIRVGDNAVVGAGSAVVINVAPCSTVFGVPAKRLGERRETFRNEIFLYGAGGHGAVIADTLKTCGTPISGFIDDAFSDKNYHGYSVYGKEKLNELDPKRVQFIVSIGNSSIRKKIADDLEASGFSFAKAIHPSAVIGSDVEIGEGTVIMAHVTVNIGTVIGKHSILNTSSSVDHHNMIGDYVHIAPSVSLCGSVYVGDYSFLAVKSSVAPGVRIGKKCILSGGSFLKQNLPDHSLATGVPAKYLKQ